LVHFRQKATASDINSIPAELEKKDQLKGFQYNWYFEGLIMILIICNSVMLAFDNPLMDPTSSKKKFISNANKGFTVAFTLEVSTRVIA